MKDRLELVGRLAGCLRRSGILPSEAEAIEKTRCVRDFARESQLGASKGPAFWRSRPLLVCEVYGDRSPISCDVVVHEPRDTVRIGAVHPTIVAREIPLEDHSDDAAIDFGASYRLRLEQQQDSLRQVR